MSDHPEHDATVMTDDEYLRFTQRTRKQLIGEMVEGGFPTDPKDRIVLLSAMADMDRTALGNKRIGASEKQAAADALVAQAIAKISHQFGRVNPFEGNEDSVVSTVPQPDHTRLPDIEVVPGETDIGICNENYKTLMEKFD